MKNKLLPLLLVSVLWAAFGTGCRCVCDAYARGVWFGEGRVAARVRVWLEAGGRTTTTVVRVPLRAGWG